MFDHPSDFNFASTSSALTGRSPAMNTELDGPARAIMKPAPAIISVPAMRRTKIRFMAVSFVISSRKRTKRFAFKAELNTDEVLIT